MERSLSIIDSFKYGFATYFKHIFFFVGLFLTAGLACGGAVVAITALSFLLLSQLPGFSAFLDQIKPLITQVQSAQQGNIQQINPQQLIGMGATVDKALSHLGLAEYALIGVYFLAISLVLIFAYLGFYNVALEIRDRGSSRIRSFFTVGSLVPKALAAHYLILLIPTLVSLGLSALGVPVLIVMAISFFTTLAVVATQYFTPFVLVDTHGGPFEVVRKGFALTHGIRFHVIAFALMAILPLQLFSMIPFLSLLNFIYLPVVLLAAADAYRTLTGGKSKSAPTAANPFHRM